MAFNSRKFQKLIEEEKKNSAEFVDEFEDDFADDFTDSFDEADVEAPTAENAEPEEEQEIAPAVEEEKAAEPEEIQETAEIEAAEEAAEEPAEPEQEEKEELPEVIALPAPEVQPAEEKYNPQAMWKDMAALAINAKECINAGAFFRANDIVTAMRSILVEMMCRANGITANFNENADNLSEECKQDIYTSYPSTLSKQALSDVVTHIMAVTYKYI